MNQDVRRIQRNVHLINLSGKRDVLLISDAHFDNKHCNRKLLKSHLDQALDRNAIILLGGDLLCLMGGKWDPRSTKKDIRPEYNSGQYVDLIVQDIVNFLTPYAHHIAVVSYGNHETNFIKRNEHDPLLRVVTELNFKTGSNIHTGGYGGWVVFKYNDGHRIKSYKMKYFHGSGGGGIVTKGTISHQRFDAMIDGADCIWMQHIHDLWDMTIQVETLSNNFKTNLKEVLHIQTSTYKDEYNDGNGGWHIERGAPPKPLGGYWIELDPARIIDENKNTDFIKIYAKAYKTDQRT
jgi:hypothetical protein